MYTPAECLNIYSDFLKTGVSQRAFADGLGVNESTLRRIIKRAQSSKASAFVAPDLPQEDLPVEELIEYKKKIFSQRKKSRDFKKLIDVRLKTNGPIAVVHLGDPHLDDDGTDIGTIEAHIKLINQTDGMFAATVGDLSNNWVGRLARLYANQSTTAAQSWKLVEWFIRATRWLYLVNGNHDVWCGAGNPITWMTKGLNIGPNCDSAVRLNLIFPNGKTCRVNARHTFAGHSQWNTAHGVSKAAQMGFRDHILVSGHTHVSGYQVVKDPASGLISHAVQVASYKTYDDFAVERGFPDQNIFCAAVTVIDPRYESDDPRFVTFLPTPEQGARYLEMLKAEYEAEK